MALFHTHQWEEMWRFFNKPKAAVESDNMPLDMASKVLFGFTLVEMKCKNCGELKFQEVHGDIIKS